MTKIEELTMALQIKRLEHELIGKTIEKLEIEIELEELMRRDPARGV